MNPTTAKLQYNSIQRDLENPQYAVSFDVQNCIEEDGGGTIYFQENGFIVIRNVFSETECEKSRNAMWGIIEDSHQGFQRLVLL
jgi:hypothetical protein